MIFKGAPAFYRTALPRPPMRSQSLSKPNNSKEDFVLAYADIRAVRDHTQINSTDLQRLWAQQERDKYQTGTERCCYCN